MTVIQIYDSLPAFFFFLSSLLPWAFICLGPKQRAGVEDKEISRPTHYPEGLQSLTGIVKNEWISCFRAQGALWRSPTGPASHRLNQPLTSLSDSEPGDLWCFSWTFRRVLPILSPPIHIRWPLSFNVLPILATASTFTSVPESFPAARPHPPPPPQRKRSIQEHSRPKLVGNECASLLQRLSASLNRWLMGACMQMSQTPHSWVG